MLRRSSDRRPHPDFMSNPPRRRLRSLLAPVHPRRLWAKLRHLAHGWGYFRLRLWLIAWQPRRLVATWRYGRLLLRTMAARRRESRLTVAVDVSALWQPLTGIGWYLYRLLESVAQRDDVRLRLYGLSLFDKEGLPEPVIELPQGPALEWVRYRVPEDLSIVHYYLSDRLRSMQDRFIAADGNDVLFAPNYYLPPWFDRAEGRLVATVHDLGLLRVPETLHDHTRQQLTQHLEATLRRTTRVLTDTETVRQELLQTGMATAERVHAVHLGPGSVAGVTTPRRPPGCPAEFVLAVGTLEPRKNLKTLFAAWRGWRRAGGTPPPLVLCGGMGWKAEELQDELEAGRDEGWLYHLGYLDDAEVAGLYDAALWVAMPSLYEGFGLPLVEAMAFGAPLLCSDIPVLREVAAEAAIYAAPLDVEAWIQQSRRLAADQELRRSLGQRAQRRQQFFDWRRTAEETVAVWRAAGQEDSMSKKTQ